MAKQTTTQHEVRSCLTTWNMSLAHFRQRLCWHGKITTGLVNISRQIGQISCFSKLSMVPRFLECDCSRDRLVTRYRKKCVQVVSFHRQQRPSSGNKMKFVNSGVSLPLPWCNGARSVFSTHTSKLSWLHGHIWKVTEAYVLKNKSPLF